MIKNLYVGQVVWTKAYEDGVYPYRIVQATLVKPHDVNEGWFIATYDNVPGAKTKNTYIFSQCAFKTKREAELYWAKDNIDHAQRMVEQSLRGLTFAVADAKKAQEEYDALKAKRKTSK